ncbi:hypothetical protein OROMI_016940 [Orobanche minor]
MCYVGKATKIFIFIVTVFLVTGLILGFSLLRHHGIHSKSNKCSSGSCPLTAPVILPRPTNPKPSSSYTPNTPTTNPNPSLAPPKQFPPPPLTSDNSGTSVPNSPLPLTMSPSPPPGDHPGTSAPEKAPPALSFSPPAMLASYPPPPVVVLEAMRPVYSPPNPVPVSPVKVEDEDKALRLILSLTSFDGHMKPILMYGKETLKYEDVTSKLLPEEKRMESSSNTSSEGAVLICRNEKKKTPLRTPT